MIITEDKQKWVTFTYTGNRTITRSLKNRNIQIAFKTTNTVGNILVKIPITNRYDVTGIYKLTWAGCRKSYIGETRCSLSIRYKEHIRA